MKAAVCYEFGKPLVVEEVTLDPPKTGEVKVRMAATAICHSDIHTIRGELAFKLPCVAGHESSGYVEEIGPGVVTVKKGDHVIISLLASCGRCYSCVHAQPENCEYNWPLLTESRLHNRQGKPLVHVTRTATFAEYAIVDQSQVVAIPLDMPMDRASLLACGVITGFGAVVNRAQVRPMSSVVVIGTGGVGLNAIQGARVSGADPIIAVDILDSKLETAKFFGATHGVRADGKDPVQEVKDITHGRGADYVFVTVGSVAALNQSYPMTGIRGTVVTVGFPPHGGTWTIPGFLWGEKTITSCNMGSTKLSVEIPKLISLYREGRLKLDELITNHYPFEKINEAIENAEKGKALRNVLMF
jgi:S-(hydroxymethyl)glutathione dehydrogenase / alcohol dehydrogenase